MGSGMLRRLLALGLGVNACSPGFAPLAPLPRDAPAASPSPAAPASVAEARPAASTSTPTAATAPSDPAASTVAPPPAPQPPGVLIETPYSALGHPRLGTEMLTLARDEELFQWALGGTSDPAHPSNRPGYHPATRVVVDVELLSRAPKGATARLLRLARSNGYWPLRACFETAQRSSAKPDRSARVRLTLSAGGKVLGARSLGPMPERDYARCVLERTRALDFTPGFGRKLDFELSVKQWPGHAPVPPHAPDGSPAVQLSKEVQAALEGLTPTLRVCYEKGLASDAKLWGRIAFKLQLGSEGAVKEATPVEANFPSAEVSECARQTVLGARFTSPGVTELTWAVRLGQPPAPPAGTPPEPSPPLAAPPASAPPTPAPPAPH
jgi:hypothetical protein